MRVVCKLLLSFGAHGPSFGATNCLGKSRVFVLKFRKHHPVLPSFITCFCPSIKFYPYIAAHETSCTLCSKPRMVHTVPSRILLLLKGARTFVSLILSMSSYCNTGGGGILHAPNKLMDNIISRLLLAK